MRDCPKKAYKAFQFTPLREGRQYAASWIEQLGGFSIHAPPRGATAAGQAWRECNRFQFTPLREGRPHGIPLFPLALYFNSRPSARGDPKFREAYIRAFISIHAPPRGATAYAKYMEEKRFISIHAPPRGATFCLELLFCTAPYFNSRPSARGDHGVPHDGTGGVHFNSRPSARGDEIAEKQDMSAGISIHAPPRGATADVPQLPSERLISIHAPPRGATAVVLMTHSADLISIHAPPRGATYCGGGSNRRQWHFNSRPSARGDDTRSSVARQMGTLFQFTPLREGRQAPTPQLGGITIFQFTPLREGRLASDVLVL